MPRGESNSSKFFEDLLKERQLESQIKKIDSVTMSNIIQKHDCIGFVNQKYIEKDVKEGRVNIINTKFTIPPTEYGIYVHKTSKTRELKQFINVLKKNFED